LLFFAAINYFKYVAVRHASSRRGGACSDRRSGMSNKKQQSMRMATRMTTRTKASVIKKIMRRAATPATQTKMLERKCH
jgi:hypothetical protein